MAEDRKDRIIKWYQKAAYDKGLENPDPIDTFMYTWIAFNILYVYANEMRQPSDRFNEEGGIINFATEYKKIWSQAMASSQSELKSLGSLIQKGLLPVYRSERNFKDLNNSIKYFSERVANDPIDFEDNELIKSCAQILNRIRNNLFHGRKIYDNQDDISFVKNAEPILFRVIEIWLKQT